jgi:hypothetical protein
LQPQNGTKKLPFIKKIPFLFFPVLAITLLFGFLDMPGISPMANDFSHSEIPVPDPNYYLVLILIIISSVLLGITFGLDTVRDRQARTNKFFITILALLPATGGLLSVIIFSRVTYSIPLNILSLLSLGWSVYCLVSAKDQNRSVPQVEAKGEYKRKQAAYITGSIVCIILAGYWMLLTPFGCALASDAEDYQWPVAILPMLIISFSALGSTYLGYGIFRKSAAIITASIIIILQIGALDLYYLISNLPT